MLNWTQATPSVQAAVAPCGGMLWFCEKEGEPAVVVAFPASVENPFMEGEPLRWGGQDCAQVRDRNEAEREGLARLARG